MPKRMKTLSLVLVAVLSILTLSGCNVRAHTSKLTEEWGRGGLIGTASQPRPVSMRIAPDGEQISLVWVTRPEEQPRDRIHFYAIDQVGQILADINLPFSPVRPRDLTLLPNQESGFDLFWLETHDDVRSLWHARLSVVVLVRGFLCFLVA